MTQKETFALMISCAASFCPFRFVARHVCRLTCCHCIWLLKPIQCHLHAPCSYFFFGSMVPLERLVPVWMHAVISMVLAIQWPSRALSSLNTCNYSHYPSSPPALSSASPTVYLSAHIFPSLTHRKQIGDKHKEGKVYKDMCDRWSRKETEEQPDRIKMGWDNEKHELHFFKDKK